MTNWYVSEYSTVHNFVNCSNSNSPNNVTNILLLVYALTWIVLLFMTVASLSFQICHSLQTAGQKSLLGFSNWMLETSLQFFVVVNMRVVILKQLTDAFKTIFHAPILSQSFESEKLTCLNLNSALIPEIHF
jgi:hypothetical protein